MGFLPRYALMVIWMIGYRKLARDSEKNRATGDALMWRRDGRLHFLYAWVFWHQIVPHCTTPAIRNGAPCPGLLPRSAFRDAMRSLPSDVTRCHNKKVRPSALINLPILIFLFYGCHLSAVTVAASYCKREPDIMGCRMKIICRRQLADANCRS